MLCAVSPHVFFLAGFLEVVYLTRTCFSSVPVSTCTCSKTSERTTANHKHQKKEDQKSFLRSSLPHAMHSKSVGKKLAPSGAIGCEGRVELLRLWEDSLEVQQKILKRGNAKHEYLGFKI